MYPSSDKKNRSAVQVLDCSGVLVPLHAFTKGNNFCDFPFASLEDEAVLKWDLFLKERICSKGRKNFPLRVDQYLEGRQH